MLDDEGADITAQRVSSRRLAAEGRVTRVVPITPIIEHLCDVLEFHASA